MDRGYTYIYSSLAFPRYHYYQTRLKQLIPRFHNILEAAGLPDCVSQGRIRLKEISSAAQDVTDQVTVNLFMEASMLEEPKFDLPKPSATIGKVKVEDLQWTGYVKSLKDTSVFLPSVTVFVTQSVENVHDLCNELTEDQRESVILYNDLTKAAVQYSSLANTSQYSQSAEGDLDKASKHSKLTEFDLEKASEQSKSMEDNLDKASQYSKFDLLRQVQYVLEVKVVTVFEMIAAYIHEFIPRLGKEVDNSLLDSIHVALIDSLKCSYIVKDLSPNNEAILGEKNLTEAHIEIVSPYIAGQWDMVASILGMSYLDKERIKMESSTIMDRSGQLLQRWKDREGENATMNYLLKLLKEVKVDVSAIERTFLSQSSDIVKDKIFKKKLTAFVINKTKCVVCDTLSTRFGISSSLLNEFLNAGFFDYPAKIIEVLAKMDIPKWPRDPTDDGVSTCRVFSYRCAMALTKVIHDTEDYIKTKLSILVVLKKLQFELHGYLSQAKVPITTPIPQLPKLPLQLQYDLLSIEEVTGCGTCYGELVLHITKNLSPARQEEVKQLLQEYKFIDGYKSVVMSESVEQVRPTVPHVQHGQQFRAQKSNSSQEYKFGSLGCFFKLTPKQDASNVGQQNAGAMISSGYVISEAKDHCLTCAHCVKDCKDNVDTRTASNVDEHMYGHLGTKKCFLYNPEAVDIASIQVADENLVVCDSRLKDIQERYVPNWRVFDVDPTRRIVHKEGCGSGFTKGIVMSADYMTQTIKDYNIAKYQKTQSLADRFDPLFNILIESSPGGGDNIEHVTTGQAVEPFDGTPFSQEGDSGSVIIEDDIDDSENVHAVALLLGAVVNNDRFVHSYGSLMKKMIEEVEVQYDCIATPSRLS